MDDEPYMVSFVWMHVQISMALCSSSVKGNLCRMRAFSCLVLRVQVLMREYVCMCVCVCETQRQRDNI